MKRPFVLGLTGSIGMGKSTVARMFAAEGAPVFDADAAVRRLQAPGGAALAGIASLFPGLTGADGLDRAALGARVFGDRAALGRLEALMHPLVAAERTRFLKRHRGRAMVVIDVPLLLETGGEAYVDAVAVVSAPARVQRARVLARPGMTRAKLHAILARQMTDGDKRAMADYVIQTGRGQRGTRMQVRAMVHSVRTELQG